ncbi:hypothetical protein ZWY2020_001293 [Hordeum vulgare]|nr:hypothetical protein ZWY2020_001293 [Hordeum vulgare]
MATPTNPKFLKWSQTAITFDHGSSNTRIPPRETAAVDPVVEGVRLRKVLMDGISGLNIMYADTLKGMGIPISKLSESSMQFHGVVPGRKAKSLGQIALDVVFGSDKNFRKEKLTFKVLDFQSAYHAILGRPASALLHGPSMLRILEAEDARPERRDHHHGQSTASRRVPAAGIKNRRPADGRPRARRVQENSRPRRPDALKKASFRVCIPVSGETKKVNIHPTDDTAAPTNISTTLDPK